MSTYVINRLIHFDNEAYVLYTAAAPEEALRIGAIASRCLTLLLQADGQIVSKRDLMRGAWGAFGLEVTDNSLAQVVRQLRVALEKLQPDHELIITIPRIGYKISEQVELLDAPPPPAPDEPPAAAVSLPAAPPQINAPPSPASQPRHSHHSSWPEKLLLGFAAIACWAALFHLPSLLRQTALPEQPFAEARMEQIDGIAFHLESMPGGALQPDNRRLAVQVKALGLALDMDALKLHVYRFAAQHRSLDLLCEGELSARDSHCLGLQLDE
ncbi:winged helix-turn-helix domain-containing protein [Pseudomonas sp.]|uniref:winged helix-turn-helix domain-containing protein n=1 Tax=Pseudomonas sp. TaxID=306 RepID=UPI003C76A8DC